MYPTPTIPRAAALFAGALLASNAAAVPFTGEGVWTGVGQDNGAVEGLSDVGGDTISWGAGVTGPQSAYSYEALEGDAPTDASLIPLGNFAHNNFRISLPSISGADLALSISFPDENAEVELALPFEHVETPNQASPCAEGGDQPCPDAVVVPSVSERVTFGDGSVYDFEVIGFSQDGGATLTTRFLTQEEAINSATLFGRLVLVSGPPVPLTSASATLPLTAVFATGLLIAARRRL